MRDILVVVLTVSLSGSVTAAQSLHLSPAAANTQSIRDSITREALALAPQQPASTDSPMSPAYKWTGIGLLGVAGLEFLFAAVSDDLCAASDLRRSDCSGLKHTFIVFGVVMAGAGGTVLLIGKHKARGVSPELVLHPGAVAIRGRFGFK